MIAIINNSGRILELDPDTSISVERHNSLFNESDSFIQDVTYSQKAGLTPNNKLFIKGGHQVGSDNKVYEMSVRVVVSGEPFYAGIFTFKIIQEKIQFTLKINFGSIANLIKITKINEIITGDAPAVFSTAPVQQDYMKDTCSNPDKYPYAFFPVENLDWPAVTSEPSNANLLMNYWVHETQNFKVLYGYLGNPTICIPFYKLSYIIEIVFKSLGFTSEGGYFEEDQAKHFYLYSRRGNSSPTQHPSTFYLPDITISEFLKQIRTRLNIAFEFDLINKKVYIESFSSILKAKKYNDITNYVTSVKEIGVAEKKGYTVTLKPDESDEQFSNGRDPKKYIPTNILTVGSGETPIEVEVSTLKERYNSDLGYYYPHSYQNVFTWEYNKITTWQLRLLEYKGMKSLPTGKVFPEARSVELGPVDAEWFMFLNDSKEIIIEAAVPPLFLSRMKASQKIRLKDKDGALFYALPEKISYNLRNKRSDLINITIEARSIVSRYSSSYTIDAPVDLTDSNLIMRYKAYFDENIHGISELKIGCIDTTGATTYVCDKISVPTDKNGLGGQIGQITAVSGDPLANRFYTEIRVYNLNPKYAIMGGRRYNFVQGSGYAFVGNMGNQLSMDPNPFWIVF